MNTPSTLRLPGFAQRICLAVALVGLGIACQPPRKAEELQAPLFENLGKHQVRITTRSGLAQQFFNQGLNLTYGFNHGEAERSYREAIRLDSTCAMCYWGAAYVLGTNYNVAMEDEVKTEAQRLTRKALENVAGVTDWEKALIEASALRYNYDKTSDQSVLDADYAGAMRKVYQQFPGNDDIADLFAESLMNLHPWDLYTKRGEAKPWTPEIVSTLEEVLKRNPEHPGANHHYIHAVEASDTPQRGLPSADRLGNVMPGVGHIVHMPSHIYIRTGDYHKGSVVNETAIVVDSIYVTTCRTQGVYPKALFPHNIHFLAATAALEGRGEVSINSAFRLTQHLDTTLMREPGWETLQHYLMIPHYVLVKFMQWDHILTLKKPEASLVYPRAVWHYARGMAYAGKNQLPRAQQELAMLNELMQDSTLRKVTIWELNSADQLLEIASRVMEAEIRRRQGDKRTAIARLKEAVAIEDKLNYNEPPDWFFSVRHSLGAVLLEAGQYAEAEAVYRDDLFFIPRNGWALNGLYQSLLGQNKREEAASVQKQFEEAWQYADIQLAASEVKPLAYRNIESNTFLGSYLAGLPKVPFCGPARK